MSVREEERQKNNCPSRGLGLAAAAIGVGVGAALYYFFNKRPENPDSEGSTSANWTCEEPQAFHRKNIQAPSTMSAKEYTGNDSFDDEYTTASDYSTTDTSIESSDSSLSVSSAASSDSTSTKSNFSLSIDTIEYSNSDLEDSGLWHNQISAQTISSDSDWEVTSDSMDVPSATMQRSPLHRFFNNVIDLLSPSPDYSNRSRRHQNYEAERLRNLREQKFRQRSWSLEECSICCEVMLKDQELEQLPCAHSFHAACVRPWLHEHRTCPNCRKLA